jgi:DNA recombination protein RmuC
MEPLTIFLSLLAGAAIVACALLLWERHRLIADRQLAEARLQDQGEAKRSFQSIADEALRTSNEQFLELARETLSARQTGMVAEMDKRREAVDRLIEPIQAAIEKTHEELQRVGQNHAGLREQVQLMSLANQELRGETSKLSQALRKPNVRGRYGEIQLERVVELAGMRSYCDFTTQKSLHDEEGNLQKPDLVVRLPNDRFIAVDAKTSIDSYMDALASEDAKEIEEHLDRYAENVLLQAQKLTRKQYWARFDYSPDFVVMFIPGDQLVDAALEHRPQLLEFAANNNIVIASPSTLIGLLRAVAIGWREKSLSDSAEELFDLGRELHQRAAIVLEKANRVGTSLESARRHYNEFVGSVQSRLVPTLRKFEERGARSSKELVEPQEIEGEGRKLRSLSPPSGEEREKRPEDAEDEQA